MEPAQRVVLVYRNPLLRDIVAGVLAGVADVALVGQYTPEELHPGRIAALRPTHVIVDQEVVDGVHDHVVDLAWRLVTNDGPKKLIVLGVQGSRVRILGRQQWDNPSEAELVGALRVA